MTQVAVIVFFLHLSAGQLASFDELRLALLKSQGIQEAREDRSLTETFPFNYVANQDARGSSHEVHQVDHQGVSHHPADHNQGSVLHQDISLHQADHNQGSVLHQDISHLPAPFHTQPYPAPVPSLTSNDYPAYQAVPSPSQTVPPPIIPSPASIISNPPQFPHFSPPASYHSSRVSASGPTHVPAHTPSRLPASTISHVPASTISHVPASVLGHVSLTLGHLEPNAGRLNHVPSVSARVVPAKNPLLIRQHLERTSFQDVAAAGRKCIDKIETVEEIEYDEVEECNHSYDRKCHTTYTTKYESQQEEECDDDYKKSCEISYSSQARNLTVQICRKPLVKDCNQAGPSICRTEYMNECWTRNDPHIVVEDVPRCHLVQEEKCQEISLGYTTEEKCNKWPREVCTLSRERKVKYNPVTKCEKVPQEVCAPSGCGFVEGPEICFDQVKTVIMDIPGEVCDLQPRRKCEHVTKLVPKLSPVERCLDVPMEVCVKGRANPRKIIKPVSKKWCYTPTQESGLV